MTTHQLTHVQLQSGPAGVDAAHAYIAQSGFFESAVGRVGLELEFFLVDVRDPCRRPDWFELSQLVGSVGDLPAGSWVTLEPGGQVELSTPPLADVVEAVSALRADRAVLAAHLAGAGWSLVSIGADPARQKLRINPASRYAAMEKHFDALGYGPSGRSMMTSTAALQINLEAGPRGSWHERFAHLTALAPVLSAISACSPMLAESSSGWQSMRQQAWLGIDRARAGGVPAGSRPDEAWARYAMRAPVMLIRDHDSGEAMSVESSIPFEAWWSGDVDLGRTASIEDLDYHLTTLFPPVRPKGYIEFRPLDAVPDRWWPAIAAVAVTLMDDPAAAPRVAELLEAHPVDAEQAARCGLTDARIAATALRAVEIAAARAPVALSDDVARLVDLVASRRTPGDELLDVARASGPVAALQEQARA